MKTAIIVGGNQGGLNMARCLSNAGFKVRLFEKKKREDLAYDWTDDINPSVFGELGLPMPDDKIYYAKKHWTFVNPNEKVKISVTGGSQDGDISIYRRPLNDYFYNLISEDSNIEINYETEVESLIISNNSVNGVVVNGEKILSDLTVDCSGVFSKLRQSLPEEWNIQKNPSKGEVFYVYRGFFNANDCEKPTMTNKAYLQHNGKKGISWCIYDEKTNEVDILIGMVDGINQKDIDEGLIALKKDNPILGDKLIKCGFLSEIPVRYPITKMVANGYVLCGDSAFMTIPMMGSGIVCSLDCGKMLYEVLKNDESCKVENLWKYQVAFYKKYASFVGVDILKRWLLGEEAEILDFLFESGVIDEELLASGTGDDGIKLSLGTMLKKGWQGRKKIGVLLSLSSLTKIIAKANKKAEDIPENYDESAIKSWQQEIDAYFKK